MRPKNLLFPLSFLPLLVHLLGGPGRASTIEYSFQANPSDIRPPTLGATPLSFVLTWPGFIGPYLRPSNVPTIPFLPIASQQTVSCAGCPSATQVAIVFQRILPGDPLFPPADIIQFNHNHYGYGFWFPAGAFDTLGTTHGLPGFNSTGTLTVREVPEPGTVLLLAAAGCGLACLVQRRAKSVTSTLVPLRSAP